MKKTLLLLALFIIAATAVAQTTTRTISGAVIDKNGNPLPNALVEATGGAESVTTDADGSFTIEVPIWLKALTARYAGLPDKTIKVIGRNNILFELKPKTSGWFLNAAYSYNWGFNDYDNAYNNIGLMGGYLNTWGGYAKIIFPIDTGNATPAISIGGIRHIYSPLYFFAGVGYAKVASWQEHRAEFSQTDGFLVEGGFMGRFDRFNIGVGVSYIHHNSYTHNMGVFATAGYCSMLLT